MKPEDIISAKNEIPGRILEEIKLRKIALIDVIYDVIYHEKLRLKTEKKDKDFHRDKKFINYIIKTSKNSDEETQKKLIKEIVSYYLEEITSEFKPLIYEISTKILPPVISTMLNAISPKKIIKHKFTPPPIEHNLIISGEYEKLKKLSQKGTVIIVPTHISNLDSPIIGLAIYKLGLPPLVYGAGLNLFKNKFFGFFMSRLGAYKVDRRKKADIYKNILKEYATYSLEAGYGNLFFPGGTRIRSGKVEEKLKKGLLGTGLQAYQNNLKNNKPNPDIYFVPLNINYQVVLEAETLIEDYLADEGKSRYIIDDDDSFKISKIIAFLNKMISLNAKIHLNFSSPLDPFGNEVDENGNSIDKNGKIIDKKRYLYENGKPVDDLQRDRAYTEILSNEILKAYKKNNIILSVNFVSYIAFKLFEKQHQKIDFYKFIKEPTIDLSIKLNNFYKESDILLNKLHKMHKKKELVLSDILIEGKSEEILADALRFSNSMSTTPPLYRKGIRLYSDNLKVLYYYHNRLANYKL